jgi:CDP-diacylglycerol--glycerol-3-phosphate 3-phosphatidyltransferase
MKASLLNVPNALSFLRLPLAVIFILTESTVGRAITIVAAAFSDFADGWVARRLHQDTGAGQIVDPVTDKLFVLVALATLAARRELSSAVVLLLLARDIYTSIAYFIVRALNWRVRFKARFIGKTVTVLQMCVMLAALVWRAAVPALVIITTLASAVAIWDYTRAILAERRARA